MERVLPSLMTTRSEVLHAALLALCPPWSSRAGSSFLSANVRCMLMCAVRKNVRLCREEAREGRGGTLRVNSSAVPKLKPIPVTSYCFITSNSCAFTSSIIPATQTSATAPVSETIGSAAVLHQVDSRLDRPSSTGPAQTQDLRAGERNAAAMRMCVGTRMCVRNSRGGGGYSQGSSGRAWGEMKRE